MKRSFVRPAVPFEPSRSCFDLSVNPTWVSCVPLYAAHGIKGNCVVEFTLESLKVAAEGKSYCHNH